MGGGFIRAPLPERTVRGPTWALAALAGLLVASGIARLPLAWPALAIGSGAVVAALAVLVLGGARRYYSAAGSAYCVALGAVALAGGLPAGYAGSPAVALLTLGLPSTGIVAAIYGAGRLVERHAGRESGTGGALLARAGTALDLLRLGRSAFAVGRTALYAGVLVLVGTAGLVLNAAGVAAPVPWIGTGRVDAVLVGYVAAVLVGFHGLAAAHTTLLTARDLAGAGRDAGRRIAGGRTGDGDRTRTGEAGGDRAAEGDAPAEREAGRRANGREGEPRANERDDDRGDAGPES